MGRAAWSRFTLFLLLHHSANCYGGGSVCAIAVPFGPHWEVLHAQDVHVGTLARWGLVRRPPSGGAWCVQSGATLEELRENIQDAYDLMVTQERQAAPLTNWDARL